MCSKVGAYLEDRGSALDSLFNSEVDRDWSMTQIKEPTVD